MQNYAPGDCVFYEGETGTELFIILEGRVGMFVEGRGKVLEVGPGESFGEPGIQSNVPRIGTVKALESTALVVITKEMFDAVAKVTNT